MGPLFPTWKPVSVGIPYSVWCEWPVSSVSFDEVVVELVTVEPVHSPASNWLHPLSHSFRQLCFMSFQKTSNPATAWNCLIACLPERVGTPILYNLAHSCLHQVQGQGTAQVRHGEDESREVLLLSCCENSLAMAVATAFSTQPVVEGCVRDVVLV